MNRRTSQTRSERVVSFHGGVTADLFLSSGCSNLVLDRCDVIVARNDPARDTICPAWLGKEVAVLTASQDVANDAEELSLPNPGVAVPKDFKTRVSEANILLERVVGCKSPLAGGASPKI